MPSCSERHSGLAAPESPSKPAFLETLRQPQPRRPQALATILGLPKISQISKVDDWLTSLDQDRQQHSKSDSHLARISHLFGSTRSLPGFEPEIPKKPTSPDPTSDTPMGSQGTRPLVGNPEYRECNLAHNGMHFRNMYEKLPTHVQGLADNMFKRRQSPEPEVEDIRKDVHLARLLNGDGDESRVTEYLRHYIFERATFSSRLEGLYDTERFYPIRRQHIPRLNNSEFSLPVSRPMPDILYGYVREGFTPKQQSQLDMIGYNEYTANSRGLTYPFFVVELKGDDGSLRVATNQCIGGAAACINMVEKLNRSIEPLPTSTVSPVETTVFSIVMNESEARLFVSWKEGDDGSGGGGYYTQQIEGLLVYKPNDYLLLRRFVRNVLEWGKDRRRRQIGAVLDATLQLPQKKRAFSAISQDAMSEDSTSEDSTTENVMSQDVIKRVSKRARR